ncbi:hypothetical protein F2P79_024599 [Pimephales promelas]|nr:hypothetical protein F2P79_024599 [Pimephales promelas]
MFSGNEICSRVMLKEEVPALMLEDENRTLSLCSSSSGERCDDTRCDFREAFWIVMAGLECNTYLCLLPARWS